MTTVGKCSSAACGIVAAWLVAVPGSALGAPATAGVSSADRASVEAPDDKKIIDHPAKYKLGYSKRYTVKGRKNDVGVCNVPPTELTLTPSERALEVRQVQTNTETCDIVLEQGVPPTEELERDAQELRASGGAAAAASRY